MAYEIVPDDPDLNAELSSILNETWHVHRMHPETWKRQWRYKDVAAARIARVLEGNREATRQCLKFNDRVLSMLIHRARELLEAGENIAVLAVPYDASVDRGE